MNVGAFSKRVPLTHERYGNTTIRPESAYQFREGHPCHGCLFTLKTQNPSCMTGRYPDANNCINAFYKKMMARRANCN